MIEPKADKSSRRRLLSVPGIRSLSSGSWRLVRRAGYPELAGSACLRNLG